MSARSRAGGEGGGHAGIQSCGHAAGRQCILYLARRILRWRRKLLRRLSKRVLEVQHLLVHGVSLMLHLARRSMGQGHEGGQLHIHKHIPLAGAGLESWVARCNVPSLCAAPSVAARPVRQEADAGPLPRPDEDFAPPRRVVALPCRKAAHPCQVVAPLLSWPPPRPQ